MEHIKFFRTVRGRQLMQVELFTYEILSKVLTDYFRQLPNSQLEEGGLLIVEIHREFS